jgi:hypothetical protein
MTFSLGATAKLSPAAGVMRSIRQAPMLPAANETSRGVVAARCVDCSWASPGEPSGGSDRVVLINIHCDERLPHFLVRQLDFLAVAADRTAVESWC